MFVLELFINNTLRNNLNYIKTLQMSSLLKKNGKEKPTQYKKKNFLKIIWRMCRGL